jgi:hypothetical protein
MIYCSYFHGKPKTSGLTFSANHTSRLCICKSKHICNIYTMWFVKHHLPSPTSGINVCQTTITSRMPHTNRYKIRLTSFNLINVFWSNLVPIFYHHRFTVYIYKYAYHCLNACQPRFAVHQCVDGNLKLYLIKQFMYFFITLLGQ